MTEAEAREKWCPFARLSEDSSNRYVPQEGLNELDPRCIASDCMMWRVDTDKWQPGEGPEGIEYPATGYCGLAGKQ